MAWSGDRSRPTQAHYPLRNFGCGAAGRRTRERPDTMGEIANRHSVESKHSDPRANAPNRTPDGGFEIISLDDKRRHLPRSIPTHHRAFPAHWSLAASDVVGRGAKLAMARDRSPVAARGKRSRRWGNFRHRREFGAAAGGDRPRARRAPSAARPPWPRAVAPLGNRPDFPFWFVGADGGGRSHRGRFVILRECA